MEAHSTSNGPAYDAVQRTSTAAPQTVDAATKEALKSQHPDKSSLRPKSLLTRLVTYAMQIPNLTPLWALHITSPMGPMPHILDLPSRDTGRTIPIYVFIPPAAHQRKANSEEEAFTGTTRPCLVDFHGGSFVMGGPLEQAPWCASLARSGVIAISVHYRMGPVWDFPAALLDAEDVVKAVLDAKDDAEGGKTEAGRYLRREIARRSDDRITGIEEQHVGLSGFSSGGNIALNMLLSIPAHLSGQNGMRSVSHTGDWPSPFINASETLRQIPALLFFPSLDARQSPFERTRPQGLPPPGQIGLFLERATEQAYLPMELRAHLRASPGQIGLFLERATDQAYLPMELRAHLRASPGLAPLGVPGGPREEIEVRKQAAREAGLLPEVTTPVDETLPTRKDATDDAESQQLDCMLPSTRAILILPELDNLSEQSEIWVKALQASDKAEISSDTDGSLISQPLQASSAKVRVHRIKGMTHGFVTFPDAFLDQKTRKCKAKVNEQARQFVVDMWRQ
ncbi:Arylacetamide deacetylase [Ceraceosorus bombacis]|uniref:Arylacetamide deacetylase n=1 Tax=Ceraceosorus bombacis TaxID=401625 RepID=A0A0P1BKY4_9BASI|nr:Arylacetamide deacetylase [Ceraceosorus bombacis]